MAAVKNLNQMAKYRMDHPEYYEAEKKKNAQRNIKAYHENEERRTKMLEYKKAKQLDPEYCKKQAEYKRAHYLRKKAHMAQLKVEKDDIPVEKN